MVNFEKMTDKEKECYEKIRYYYIESAAGEDDLSYLVDEVVKNMIKMRNFIIQFQMMFLLLNLIIAK